MLSSQSNMRISARTPFQANGSARAVVVRPIQRTRPVVVAQAAAPEAPAVEAAVPTGPKTGVARVSFQRGSVFKVRRVLDTIRGKSYEDALILMEYMPYRACETILKALLSAGANAKHNQKAMKAKLVVSECFADQGPYLKRFRPRAKGRGFQILKPTFHMTLKVEEKAETA